ncbi:MAG TPA: hypothetical protein VNC41_19125 [Acidimicrobiia bacterium]|jgi:hypothetical protein|nr:hypothetical protein [Acidimicrobiia bacterium]
MPTNRKTLKAYQLTDMRRSAVMVAARKRKAAERHDERARQFREEAAALDAEAARLTEQLEAAS